MTLVLLATLAAAAAIAAGVTFARRGRRPTLGVRSSLSDAEKHLARCRRREEEALVFAVRVPAAERECVAALAGAIRLTDGVGVSSRGRDCVVHGVVDAVEESAVAISRRVQELGLAPNGSVGWARFPADGLTLAGLIDVALAAGEANERRLPRLSDNHDPARADGRGERIVYGTERA